MVTVFLLCVTSYATYRVVSDGYSLLFPSRVHAPPRVSSTTADKAKIDIKPINVRTLEDPSPQPTGSLAVSVGISLAVDLLAIFALVWLWRRKHIVYSDELVDQGSPSKDGATLVANDLQEGASAELRPDYVRGKVNSFQARNETHRPIWGREPKS
jgi:hypothetical protein